MMMYEMDDIERASLKGGESVCQECGLPLPYRCATEVCDACLSKPVANGPRPVGPVAAPRLIADEDPTPLLCVECGELLPHGGQPLGPYGTPVCARCAAALPNPPWPQEPAFNSPEAVAQAAETIRAGNRVLDSEEQREMLDLIDLQRDEHEVEAERLRAEVERLRGCGRNIAIALKVAEEQRDALADALLACDWSYGRAQEHVVEEKIKTALQKAGRS